MCYKTKKFKKKDIEKILQLKNHDNLQGWDDLTLYCSVKAVEEKIIHLNKYIETSGYAFVSCLKKRKKPQMVEETNFHLQVE